MQNMVSFSKDSPAICTLFAHGLNLVAHTLSLMVGIAIGRVNVAGLTETLLIEFWQLLAHSHLLIVTRKRSQM